jgi:transposase
VIAPTLIPVRPGDKVKTDRRDALKLARCYRAGDLSPCWVPDATHEALRDLIRTREAAKRDQQRARRRLATFLLRHGKRRPDSLKTAWSTHHMKWIKSAVHFELPAQEATLIDYVHEVEHVALRIGRLDQASRDAIAAAPERMREVIQALQALRGVAEIGAATVATEIGEFSRFKGAKQLMGYSGFVSREYSSGRHRYQGSITKSGNAHLRRVLVEAAWAYQYKPWLGGYLLKRQINVTPEVKEIAWKAQHRLHARFRALLSAGKNKPKIVTAIGRELLGFIWEIGVRTEAEYESKSKNKTADKVIAPERANRSRVTRLLTTKPNIEQVAEVAIAGAMRRRTLVSFVQRATNIVTALVDAKSANSVRGSSRRMMLMRFRPANTRLISRRDEHLDRHLYCLIKGGPM